MQERDKQRRKKLRLMLSVLNRERKKQRFQIDILCNDLITAQREFIKKFDIISFTANFYESVVGTTDLNSLMLTVARLIMNEIADANIVLVLRQQDNFELHMLEDDQPITIDKHRLEHCLTNEVVENICKSNKLCTLDDMFAMGLQGNPSCLSKISAATIPLGGLGPSLGFILIYRPSGKKLTDLELNRISAVAPGLSKAITACQVSSHFDY